MLINNNDGRPHPVHAIVYMWDGKKQNIQEDV